MMNLNNNTSGLVGFLGLLGRKDIAEAVETIAAPAGRTDEPSWVETAPTATTDGSGWDTRAVLREWHLDADIALAVATDPSAPAHQRAAANDALASNATIERDLGPSVASMR